MKLISWNVNGIRACVKKGFSRNETYKTTDESNSDIEQTVQTGIREVARTNKR